METHVTIVTSHEEGYEEYEFLALTNGLALIRVPDRILERLFPAGLPVKDEVDKALSWLQFRFSPRGETSDTPQLTAGIPFLLYLHGFKRWDGIGERLVNSTIEAVETVVLFPHQAS